LYDSTMRAATAPDDAVRIERVGHVVRVIGDSWCSVDSPELTATEAPEVVAEQTAFLRTLGREVEWKVYGHDQPPRLGELLRSAGYFADPLETLEVLDLSEPLDVGPVRAGLQVRRVVDSEGLSIAGKVSLDAFGLGEGWNLGEYEKRLADPSFAAFVAYVDGVPVSSARLEMPRERPFASLWGGGTTPQYRRQGIYRKLVAVRAELARQHGYRFLTVDARETSRPILERIGFRPLTTITGWKLKP